MADGTPLPTIVKIQLAVALVALGVTVGAAFQLSALLRSKHQVEAELAAAVSHAQAVLDSVQLRVSDAEARLGALRNEIALAQKQKGSASEAQQALQRVAESAEQLGSGLQQTTVITSQARDSFRGLAPGSPVIITIQIHYKAKLKYRRWITQNVVVEAGTVDSGMTRLELPYGGYIYFEAENLATGTVSTRGVDCRGGCVVEFP